MKIVLTFIIFIFSITLHSQTEYAGVENRVYDFLERMENRGIIKDYNSFELPKTREETASYLTQIITKKSLLSETDNEILNDYLIEFEYELNRSLQNSRKIIDNNGYNYFDENQKYLYFSARENFNIFINLFAEGEYIHNYKKNISNNNASSGNLGGIIRGNIIDKFGFYLKGTNGKVFGNTTAALSKINLAQNFKFNEKPDDSFFDETEGYLTADFDLIKFKFGRDYINLGYGSAPLVSDYSPRFDYFRIYINYDFFSYSFLHAKMINMELSNGIPVYTDKFLVYHRIGFNTGKHFDFGIGEFVVYGARGIDLSYLNPFVFYKSIEHSNRDRDNSMLFFDLNNNTIPRTKLYFSLLMDDIAYSKLGTGWWGNQVLLNTGFIVSDIADLPVDISGTYQRVEPYTFTHRFQRNNFTNFGYGLSQFSMPNSALLSAGVRYRLNYRLELSGSLTYILHGANPVTAGGITNVGGDILLGHRDTDSENVQFMDGIKEYYRNYQFSVFYEPINQIQLKLEVIYLNYSTQIVQSQKEIQSFFTLTTVF